MKEQTKNMITTHNLEAWLAPGLNQSKLLVVTTQALHLPVHLKHLPEVNTMTNVKNTHSHSALTLLGLSHHALWICTHKHIQPPSFHDCISISKDR